ncbi:MAG: Na(+)/H(+) antiporter NhaA [Sulfuricurvum sp. RIFOXYD2_FULL_44_160]|uniref:Na(+)/H(+) antiporter NhaA n=1 Tax=Sulfuricurvum kujiense TaxID=148813 RepID=A0A2D3WPY4_9BACT|nr:MULTISPECIES: Na+/H+ antiporter NhaA [Sulfuricurvum]OHD95212.1 MAG: Na(+)/H(+) antiporter NhaA [Sulfuricurvum sp. RIFOXYD12_FULL_44_77]OHD99104.1 MAG: Na(+)/H(+) antiporter NhaA [Sulfuricurvum sp. RIFOXYD2_FULL_44_160]DAB38763.1 MAG TPA: Na+/H+ antiporter NhaA [Sulfuricurvum kujiense]
MLKYSLLNFFKLESATGILLVLATLFAMIMANTNLHSLYDALTSIPVVISIGELVIAKPLLLWINDGLMAVFFFMIGLEIKREVIEGSLSDPKAIAVPAFAALGGMAVPSLIYAWFNWNNPIALQGWAIPSATDIAFALGILTLLGDRVPKGLKLFLLALAIIDDLGAIIIIALFYTSELSSVSLITAATMIALLIIMNIKGVINHTAYILVGIVLWTAVLKSGVHATLAGVILGLLIPLKNNKPSFHALEHSLHAPVNFIILPLFAFANTGIGFSNISAQDFYDNITLGIAFGLFIGKQAGVFLFSALAVWMGFGKLPYGVNWGQLYGVSIISGIGFTMSLFIGSLAFEHARAGGLALCDERLGILLGSLLSGVIGYAVLRYFLTKPLKSDGFE